MSGPESRPMDLTPLDPESRRAGFWDAYHADVMDGAALPLARRRSLAEPHVPDLLFQWGRMVAPVAAAAAILAALALTRGGPVPSPEPIAVEDLLASDFSAIEGLSVAFTEAGIGDPIRRDW